MAQVLTGYVMSWLQTHRTREWMGHLEIIWSNPSFSSNATQNQLPSTMSRQLFSTPTHCLWKRGWETVRWEIILFLHIRPLKKFRHWTFRDYSKWQQESMKLAVTCAICLLKNKHNCTRFWITVFTGCGGKMCECLVRKWMAEKDNFNKSIF